MVRYRTVKLIANIYCEFTYSKKNIPYWWFFFFKFNYWYRYEVPYNGNEISVPVQRWTVPYGTDSITFTGKVPNVWISTMTNGSFSNIHGNRTVPVRNDIELHSTIISYRAQSENISRMIYYCSNLLKRYRTSIVPIICKKIERTYAYKL